MKPVRLAVVWVAAVFAAADEVPPQLPPLPAEIYDVPGEVLWSHEAVKKQPIELIPLMLRHLEYARGVRQEIVRTGGATPYSSEYQVMSMLSTLLKAHWEELCPKGQKPTPLYEQAVAALVRSIDERAGETLDYMAEFSNLPDPRIQKALRRSEEARKAQGPRSEAWWKLYEKLQEANGGEDPHGLPEDFDQQVDAELARMIAAGEVAAPQPTGSEIPAPPRPEGWQQPIDPLTASAARQAAGEVFSLRRWSGWQLGALAALIAASVWTLWRRFARKI